MYINVYACAFVLMKTYDNKPTHARCFQTLDAKRKTEGFFAGNSQLWSIMPLKCMLVLKKKYVMANIASLKYATTDKLSGYKTENRQI